MVGGAAAAAPAPAVVDGLIRAEDGNICLRLLLLPALPLTLPGTVPRARGVCVNPEAIGGGPLPVGGPLATGGGPAPLLPEDVGGPFCGCPLGALLFDGNEVGGPADLPFPFLV